MISKSFSFKWVCVRVCVCAFVWKRCVSELSFVGQKDRRWTRGPGDQGEARGERLQTREREEVGKEGGRTTQPGGAGGALLASSSFFQPPLTKP